MAHLSLTELEALALEEASSRARAHVGECARCQSALEQLRAEREEFERVAPLEALLQRLEAEAGQERGEGSGDTAASWAPATATESSQPTGSADIAPSLGQTALTAASAKLKFQLDTGLLWVEERGQRLWLGDRVDLEAYLEGAWFESPPTRALALSPSIEALARADIEAELGRLEPKLAALGWVRGGATERAETSGTTKAEGEAGPGGAAAAAASWPAGALRSGQWHWGRFLPEFWQRWRSHLGWGAPLVLAPTALLLLARWPREEPPLVGPVAQELPQRSAPAEGLAGDIQGGSAVGRGLHELRERFTAKGGQGLAGELAAIRKRGEEQELLSGEVVVIPGDRLRLRFTLPKAGRVIGGIVTEAGDWQPLFDEQFAAGTHTPLATVLTNEEPGGGVVLVGSPEAVARARVRGSANGVQSLRLVWKARVGSGPPRAARTRSWLP